MGVRLRLDLLLLNEGGKHMAKVLSTQISFPPSTSPDVKGYKLYMEEAPNPVTYESPAFDLGLNTTVILSTLPGMETKDGPYNLGVSAYDDAGNESDMSRVDNLPLDFAAPAAPGDIVITRS